MYKTMSEGDAKKFLSDHQNSGGFGYITPVGRDGIYGHQVTYWKDD